MHFSPNISDIFNSNETVPVQEETKHLTPISPPPEGLCRWDSATKRQKEFWFCVSPYTSLTGILKFVKMETCCPLHKSKGNGCETPGDVET